MLVQYLSYFLLPVSFRQQQRSLSSGIPGVHISTFGDEQLNQNLVTAPDGDEQCVLDPVKEVKTLRVCYNRGVRW